MARMLLVCTLATAALAAPLARAAAQDTPPATPSSLFTEVQAARGDKVYQKVCVDCHERLEYTGPDFRSKWNGRPAFDLFDLLRSTMPDDGPGTLPPQDYADILAYMMKLNGVPPGKTELPADPAALKKIKMDIPGGVPAPVFSR